MNKPWTSVFSILPNCCALSKHTGRGVWCHDFNCGERSNNSGKCVFIITEESGRSRNSGSFISLHTEILCWSRNSGPVLFRSYRTTVHVPEILDAVLVSRQMLCTFQYF
jgi:hypothetical protein